MDSVVHNEYYRAMFDLYGNGIFREHFQKGVTRIFGGEDSKLFSCIGLDVLDATYGRLVS